MASRVVHVKNLLTSRLVVNQGNIQLRNKSQFLAPYQKKTTAFTWTGMKRHPAVLPLVFIMGGTTIGLVGYIIYACNTRENLVFNKSKQTYSESMNLLNPRSLKMHDLRDYAPMHELANLYKEMYGDTTTTPTN